MNETYLIHCSQAEIFDDLKNSRFEDLKEAGVFPMFGTDLSIGFYFDRPINKDGSKPHIAINLSLQDAKALRSALTAAIKEIEEGE